VPTRRSKTTNITKDDITLQQVTFWIKNKQQFSDPAGRAHDAPLDPIVGCGRGISLSK